MKRKILTGLLSVLSWGVIMGANGKVKELSRYYTFPEMSGSIQLEKGSAELNLPDDFANQFLLRFRLDDKALKKEGSLLSLGDALRMDVGDGELRAVVSLCDSLTGPEPKHRVMTVGVPVSIIDRSRSEHKVAVHYNGSHFSIYVDGRLHDNDFPIGTPAPGRIKADIAGSVKDLTLSVSPVTATRIGESTLSDIQYWTPPYHNASVGDVVACWADGRYHLFYLFDRRGHGSKFGFGGHYFEHLSSADLLNWTEHEEATPIEEQWETFGTGTPFEKDGKIYLTYGLHTTRIYPQERTIQPNIKDNLSMHGASRCIDYDTLTNLMPAGATYAVSEDGGNTFRKSHKLFHYCENPSIWVADDGSLAMYANYGAKGAWVSDDLENGWRSTDPNFPEGRDCTFPFTVGDYDYVIGGFSGMWRKPKGSGISDFTDISSIGEDCYDGLSVPAVTTLPDGRTLMAGWVKILNWGGALAIHEMVECSDGVPGTKFVEELIPEFPLIGELRPGETKGVPESYRYYFEVLPEEKGDGRVILKFGEENYWILDPGADRISYTCDPDTPGKFLSEGGDVSSARNYAIPARLKDAARIPVRVVVKYDPKFDGSIIDIEVNGNRSMISYHSGLKSTLLTRLHFLSPSDK